MVKSLEQILRSPDWAMASYEKVPSDRGEYFVQRYKIAENKIKLKGGAPEAINYTKLDMAKVKGKDGKVRAKVLEKIVKKLASKLGGVIFDAEYTQKSDEQFYTATIKPKPGFWEGIAYVGNGEYGAFDREIEVQINKADGTVKIEAKYKDEKLPQAVVINDVNRMYKALRSMSGYFTVNPRQEAEAARQTAAPAGQQGQGDQQDDYVNMRVPRALAEQIQATQQHA